MDLFQLQKKINYSFRNPGLLLRALAHRSYAHERGCPDNERMEFFGDSLVGMIVSEYLYGEFGEYSEGELSALKSYLVSGPVLAEASEKAGLGGFCLLGRGEELGGGRRKLSLLAAVFEAVAAAIYIDGGMRECRNFVLGRLSGKVGEFDRETRGGQYKGLFQELAQAEFGLKPVYVVERTGGPGGGRKFRVRADLAGITFGAGEGASRKEAEKAAARNGWEAALGMRPAQRMPAAGKRDS